MLVDDEQYEGGSSSGFRWSPKELVDICHLDNKSPDPKTGVVISSALLVEKFGGLESLASALNTNLKSGLSPNEVNEARKSFYAVNFFEPPKIKGLYELVMENFDDKINLILLAAAAVSIVIGLIKDGWPMGLIEGTSIMIALVIIIVVNSGNNWISERQLANLVALQDIQEVAVHRGSEYDTKTIDSSELLVGDIVSFKDGEKVPADMVLVEG